MPLFKRKIKDWPLWRKTLKPLWLRIRNKALEEVAEEGKNQADSAKKKVKEL